MTNVRYSAESVVGRGQAIALPAGDAAEADTFGEAVELELPHGLERMNDHGGRLGHGPNLPVGPPRRQTCG